VRIVLDPELQFGKPRVKRIQQQTLLVRAASISLLWSTAAMRPTLFTVDSTLHPDPDTR
jgi:hypothetical protein